MKLALGCDHGGYLLKEEVKKHLDEKNPVTIPIWRMPPAKR